MKMSYVQMLRQFIERGAQVLEDEEAMEAVELHEAWLPGVKYTTENGRPVGHRVRRPDGLFRLRQEHTGQTGWEPENTPAMWERVCESHTGAEDDPIPYKAGMALTKGLCYEEEGVVYRCTRDSGNPVYGPLAELVGLYVEMIRSASAIPCDHPGRHG